MTEKEMQKLKEIDEVIAKGTYQDTWESLQQYEQPRWFRDAKFGIFIHWGVYSVPAFANEWYSRNMYIQGTPEFAFMFGTAVVDIERGQFADVKPFHWQTDEAMATNSWCYTDGNQYRTAAELQHMRQNIQDADMEKENFFCGCVFFCFSE